MKTVLPIALFLLFLLSPVGILLLAVERDGILHPQFREEPVSTRAISSNQELRTIDTVFQLIDCARAESHCVANHSNFTVHGEDLLSELDKEILHMRKNPSSYSEEEWNKVISSLLQIKDERIILQVVSIIKANRYFDKYLKLLLERMDGAVDPRILSEATPIFERNISDVESQRLIYSFLEKQIFHGTFYGSREVAISIRHLIRADNIVIFQAWLDKLPKKTATYTLLKKSLDESTVREPSSISNKSMSN
ncbi:MAG: hypothetical protein M9962_13935 [Oligoflexia bacterium]|nr:hypothetical protein [Oligoflexia bacterium]